MNHTGEIALRVFLNLKGTVGTENSSFDLYQHGIDPAEQGKSLVFWPADTITACTGLARAALQNRISGTAHWGNEIRLVNAPILG
ncbi:hypothetical protein [Acidithiobacillus thiooxidans]|uniref:Uncharacterized protein n=1 Tax=Acidithiobacillus thiooxidans ATCC 19377 TaxID=637390 RepID=A0A543Q010_ACITH|nr:hypothetical protein [Acidithiobacillus thiooxidans]MDX5936339.1 hypothetical protein [Acidithiobacillus thiooxidans]TQN49664.1 hypothetical protein DLNHIDIE_03074 [Acidithiobacillus thiooxidans ATCC 19377]